MSLSITKELESSLRLAFAEAKARRHEHVTLEHLLYALLRDPVATRILRACGARLLELKRDLESHLQESQPQLPEGSERDPEQTRAPAGGEVVPRDKGHAVRGSLLRDRWAYLH